MNRVNKKIIGTDQSASVFLVPADKDYLATRLLFGTGSLTTLAAYHAQQALEKYLKAFTVQQDKKYLKDHNLEKLRQMASNYNSYFSQPDFKEGLEKFNVFDQVARYSAEASYDPLAIKTPEFESKGVFVFSFSHLTILDKLVYEIRQLFDFTRIRTVDSLKAILEDRNDVQLVVTWKLPIPLKEILTIKNDFFK